MSIQNCFNCGEVTRDADFETESGMTAGDQWYCDNCSENAVKGPVKPVSSKVDTKTLDNMIKRLEADLIEMRRMEIFGKD